MDRLFSDSRVESSTRRRGLPTDEATWLSWLGLAARLVVGGAWIWAGLLTVTDPIGSIEAVRAYELLPASLVEPVGYLLPPLELVVGVTLVAGVLVRGAAALSAVMLVAFVIATSAAWARGLEIDLRFLGDGGVDPDASSPYPWAIACDVGLLALSLLLLRLRQSRLALDSLLLRPTPVSSPTTEGSDT